jgi:outer membrane protein OmpA-like peptidoglycan-associated protein
LTPNPSRSNLPNGSGAAARTGRHAAKLRQGRAMRTAGLIISVAAFGFAAGHADAQVDAQCSARSLPPNAPMPEPFLVFFDWDSVAITSQAASVLDHSASLLAAIPACPVVVAGHADMSGPAGYNMALSRRRAEAVRAYLRRHGVGANVAIMAFGETRPLVQARDGVREPRNRYVAISIGLNP